MPNPAIIPSIPRRFPSRAIAKGEEVPAAPVNLPVLNQRSTNIFIPTVYGNSQKYGTVFYGGQWVRLSGPNVPPPQSFPPGTPLVIPAGYAIAPFTATSIDYATIMVSWATPQGAFVDFRLLRNRFGFPVDQNDGTVLLDAATGGGYPGSQFFDSQVIPGTYHYYGIYILIQLQGQQVWYRAGLTSVLAPDTKYSSSNWLLGRIPEYYKVLDGTELTTAVV